MFFLTRAGALRQTIKLLWPKEEKNVIEVYPPRILLLGTNHGFKKTKLSIDLIIFERYIIQWFFNAYLHPLKIIM